MKKNGHRLLTLAALVGTAAGVIHIMTGVLERFFIQNRDMAPLFFLFMISCQVLPVMNGMP